MRITNLEKVAGVMAAAVTMLAAPQAKADVVTYTLGLGNSAILGYTGPYATAKVDLTDSTHATITFMSLASGSFTYLLGDGGSVAVNVNASSWTLGTITGSNTGTGYTPGPFSDGGSNNEDGFGSFNQNINSFDGNGHSSTTISFIITDTSGTWASADDVLAANGSGYKAAAHIFVTPSPANASNDNPATGYATVPEPTTMIAGALLLLPFGASTLRIVRRNQAA
jgi:hypothetical protein